MWLTPKEDAMNEKYGQVLKGQQDPTVKQMAGAGAVFGGLAGWGVGGTLFVIGFLLSLTGIGAVIGVPLIIIGVIVGLAMPVLGGLFGALGATKTVKTFEQATTTAIDAAKRARELSDRFLSLGNMRGKTFDEIKAVVGLPTNIAHGTNGGMGAVWQAGGYQVALSFLNGKFVRVHSETK
jgi:hypothetical protein